MAGPPAGPKTESELLRQLPATNRPGAFPRSLIAPDERIFFEGRPTLSGLRWGWIIVLGLVGALFLYAAIELVTNAFGWVFVALVALAILALVLQFRNTAYALTDRRVIRVSGARKQRVVDALYDQVQNMRLIPGHPGGIRFDATPPRAPTGVLGQSKYAKSLVWGSLADSERVYDFVQAAFSLHTYQNHDAMLRADLLAKVTENRIPCEYCRTLVSLQTIDYASPKCPSCGAPLVHSGVGSALGAGRF